MNGGASPLQVGTESVADFRTLVFQNITIVDSHRGLSIQLRDGGSVENVLFENIDMTLQQYVGDEWGNAEPIYVTALPRNAQTQARLCSSACQGWAVLAACWQQPSRLSCMLCSPP